MNKDDFIQLLEKLSLCSDITINVFIVGDINQINNDNASISILSDCCNFSPNSNFKGSV